MLVNTTTRKSAQHKSALLKKVRHISAEQHSTLSVNSAPDPSAFEEPLSDAAADLDAICGHVSLFRDFCQIIVGAVCEDSTLSGHS
jgi:hypothetical protein